MPGQNIIMNPAGPGSEAAQCQAYSSPHFMPSLTTQATSPSFFFLKNPFLIHQEKRNAVQKSHSAEFPRAEVSW